jgi:alpha-beta hydrolase superfamily lysophospholipase
LTREAFFSPDISDAKLNEYFKKMIPESFLAGVEACFNLPHPDRVKTPMLVLGGEIDQVFTIGELKRTAKAYHAEAEFFPMAHDIMLEEGWEKVAERIIEWIGERRL